MKILCVSYFYPGPIWDTLIKSSNGEVSAIINPHNGVGETQNADYARLCTKLRRAGVRILGYISTRWGDRPQSQIGEEMTQYELMYGVWDFFLDEAATLPDKLPYYKNLYALSSGLIVLNHGTIPDEAYLECGDVLVVFESTYAKHTLVKFPHWMKRYPKNRFAQIIHSAPDWARAKRAMAKASETSGFVYVTDDTEAPDDNPYDVLPSYWQKELKQCQSIAK